MPNYIIFIACLIVVILAIVAFYMQRQVHKMEKEKAQQQQELEGLKENHQQYLNNSIQILAQGITDEQVTMTEGAIRISVLLDNLNIDETTREEYSAFFQLAEATSHIPILSAWKKLPKKEKARFDKERAEKEGQYKEFILDAAQRIKGKQF